MQEIIMATQAMIDDVATAAGRAITEVNRLPSPAMRFAALVHFVDHVVDEIFVGFVGRERSIDIGQRIAGRVPELVLEELPRATRQDEQEARE